MNNEKQEDQSFLKDLKNRLTDFSDWDKKTWGFVVAFALLMVATAYLLYKSLFGPDHDTFLFGIVMHYVIIPIQKIGWWGIIFFLVFMVIQGFLAPIPSELVLITAGMIWSFATGFTIGMIGSMMAGYSCFLLSKKGGRPIVEKAVGAKNIETLDLFIGKYGSPVIFTARAFPFFAFDPISYVSGIVNIETKKYMIATFLGSIIRVAFYTWVGGQLLGDGVNINDMTEVQLQSLITTHGATFNYYFYLIMVILVVSFALYQFILMPILHKKAAIMKSDENTQDIEKPVEENTI